ncbi:MAG: 6-phosphofructokinase [Lentisphaerae bacterium]|nr:6-phosphofructokinase [Lentisphaerota bacterium]
MTAGAKNIIAVLTSGGDAPGMNAAVRAVVRGGIAYGMQVYMVYEGYQGLIEGHIVPADWNSVSGILPLGGTVIGSARCKDFRTRAGLLTAAENLVKNGINRLIVIGGDGSLSGADEFSSDWSDLCEELLQTGRITEAQRAACPALRVIGMVGSIDNDLANSDMTIGADTALHRIVDAIDALRSTAFSHQRIFVVEVMGRNCGYLALMSAIATGSAWVFVPEHPPQDGWEDELCCKLEDGRKAGRRDNIIIMAEGARDIHGNPITSAMVKETIETKLNSECRITILGHVQRGGAPSAYDRYMSTAYGYQAIKELLKNDSSNTSQIVVSQHNRVTMVPLLETVAKTRAISASIKNGNFDEAEKMRGISWAKICHLVSVNAQSKPEKELHEDSPRIAVITSGWPAPGMNNALRAIVRMGMNNGYRVFGIEDGVEGLLKGRFHEFQWMEVDHWPGIGGTKLGTNRSLPKECDLYRIAANLEKHRINALIIIGGWTAYTLASKLLAARNNFEIFKMPTICIPASINNNIPGAELSIGCDTALNTIVEAVDKIKKSADSARRLFVVEVMGRYCGFLAMMSGMACGAEYIYTHEMGINVDMLQNHTHELVDEFKDGRRTALIISNENANPTYDINFICSLFDEEGGKWFDVRKSILGPIQQGGQPTPFDRILAARLAYEAVAKIIDQLNKGDHSSLLIGQKQGKTALYELESLDKIAIKEFQRPKNQWWENYYEIAHILANRSKTKSN